MQAFLELDYQIFRALNSLAGKIDLFDYLAILCAKYLIFFILGLAAGWWISMHKSKVSKDWPIEGRKKWLIFGQLTLAPLFSLFVNQILGLIKFRIRPFYNLDILTLVNPLSEKSFPSDHTAVVFALSTVVFFYNKRLGLIMFLLSFLVGFFRIVVGVHYPLDILGGILSGALSAIIFYYIFKLKAFKRS